MKLPSGREISNETLAEIIDSWVAEAIQDESFNDAMGVIADFLSDENWEENDPAPYSKQDVDAILDEIRETAAEFWEALWLRFGELHVRIVQKKYPHKD